MAIAALKKALDLHTQSQKVLAARQKNCVEERAEMETAQRMKAEREKRKATGVELFALHATPFFEWLLADSDDEEDSEEEEDGKKAVDVS